MIYTIQLTLTLNDSTQRSDSIQRCNSILHARKQRRPAARRTDVQLNRRMNDMNYKRHDVNVAAASAQLLQSGLQLTGDLIMNR